MVDLPAFEGLVGDSPAMRALFARIARVAVVDVPVLIPKESGTGKELVAAALHRLSRRRTARFEPVNCGGLTPELLRSDLFGHERGAFTGAVERQPGLIPAADGGTVLLDEVGELPAPAQAMLLRFLAEGEVRPVGATRTTQVDVRVIAATHRDLLAATPRGRRPARWISANRVRPAHPCPERWRAWSPCPWPARWISSHCRSSCCLTSSESSSCTDARASDMPPRPRPAGPQRQAAARSDPAYSARPRGPLLVGRRPAWRPRPAAETGFEQAHDQTGDVTSPLPRSTRRAGNRDPRAVTESKS
jgi:hypothetical protein